MLNNKNIINPAAVAFTIASALTPYTQAFADKIGDIDPENNQITENVGDKELLEQSRLFGPNPLLNNFDPDAQNYLLHNNLYLDNNLEKDNASISIDIHSTATQDDTQNLKHGDNASLEITVENDGNTPLNNVDVVVAIHNYCNKLIGTLQPGQDHTYTCEIANVQNSVRIIAETTGTYKDGNQIIDQDPTNIQIFQHNN